MSRRNTDDSIAVAMGCGFFLFVLVAVIAWVAVLVFAGKLAVYFGYPFWVGVAVYLVVSALLGALRGK